MKLFVLAALSATLAVPAFACPDCMGDDEAAPAKVAAPKAVATVKMTTLSAPKMHCAGCAQGIKTVLMKQKGVKTVVADSKTKLVMVSYLSAQQNPKMLAATLTKAGWPATEQKVADKAVKTGAKITCTDCKAPKA